MSNNIAKDVLNLPYYVAMFQGRSVAIKRDADYQNTIKLVQRSIAKLRGVDAQDILISTTLTDYGDALVQISEDIWPDVVSDVRSVEISLDDPTDTGHPASGRVDGGGGNAVPAQPGALVAAAATTNSIAEPPRRAMSHQTVQDPTNTSIETFGTLSITVRTESQNLLECSDLRSSSTIGNVKSLIETTYDVPAALQELDLLGQTLDDTKTLEQYHVTDWTILDLHLNARQYMIYLYPDPTLQTSEVFRHKDVEVKLSLNRAWELAALRPSRAMPSKYCTQSMSWTVDVAEGELLDHGSNAKLTHLFWDGISQPAQPITPDSSFPRSHPEPHLLLGCSNLVPLLDPTNSAAVHSSNIEIYITSIFKNHLGFANNSPLPTDFTSHLKQNPHGYIALRFVPQAECEAISSLSVSPPAERIIRILVLYKGLSTAAARIWDIPQPRYNQGHAAWKDVIGIEPDNYWNNHNMAGFKVLEIAWMEVF